MRMAAKPAQTNLKRHRRPVQNPFRQIHFARRRKPVRELLSPQRQDVPRPKFGRSSHRARRRKPIKCLSPQWQHVRRPKLGRNSRRAQRRKPVPNRYR